MKYSNATADDTRAFASALASIVQAGDVVLLAGDLGSGKTTFVQGFARGLDVREPVTSPTFTLVQQYEGRLPIAHVDVYRLDRVQELIDLGFEEFADDGCVTIVEWGDVVARAFAGDHLVVRIEALASGVREFVLEFEGRWQSRRRAVEEALGGFA